MSGLPSLDLDVQFSRAGTTYRATITRSPVGEGQAVTFGKLLSDLELENFVLKVGRSRARTRRVEAEPVVAAKQVGGRLFEAVFAGIMRECLRRSIDRAQEEQAALRIRLRLSDCPELADLPWELLYDRDDDWFLALSDRTPVVRYVQMPNPPRAIPVTLPLRILVIRSEPTDYPPLDLADEWAQVAEALGELDRAADLSFTELAAPTLSELRRALMRDTFHVLHYMGHGGFDAQRGGVLVFTDRAGRSVPVTSGDLGVMLHDHESLRLAVLNACEAGRTDPADPFAGVADTLVRRGIPAVVAMQFEVSDKAAVEFAPALYGALATGRPVDVAVAEARKAMYTVSLLEWATPILYLRAEDARLFTIARPAEPATDKAAARADDGDRLRGRRQYADAEAAYRAAIDLDRRLIRAHVGLGWVLYKTNRDTEAEAAFREAVRLDPARAGAHRGLGWVLYEAKRYTEAEAAFREAIRLDPAKADAHDDLGWALYKMSRYAEAEAAFQEVLRLDPAKADAHNGLGWVRYETERYAEAEVAFREAIRLDPAHDYAHNGLGRVLYEAKRYVEAEAVHRVALRLDPAKADTHVNLGWALYKMSRYAEAEAAFRDAVRLDPASDDAHDGVGWVLYETERYAAAEVAFREAIRLDPGKGDAHTGLGWALYKTSRDAEAEAAFREAIRLDPASDDAHDGLGWALYEAGRDAEAEAAFREAIRLDPANDDAHNGLSKLLDD
jgi:tetratricopeptide (TPR) repeat protein